MKSRLPGYDAWLEQPFQEMCKQAEREEALDEEALGLEGIERDEWIAAQRKADRAEADSLARDLWEERELARRLGEL
jgi:hypothetical protein